MLRRSRVLPPGAAHPSDAPTTPGVRRAARARLFPGHAGEGPKRISAELGREKWGGIKIHPTASKGCSKCHGLHTPAKRLALIAGTAAPQEPEESQERQEERDLEVSRPVRAGADGLLLPRRASRESKGLPGNTLPSTSPRPTLGRRSTSPPRTHRRADTSALARRVAQELAQKGWRLEKVMTDNASEFRASEFTATIEGRQGHHVFIRGRASPDQRVRRAGAENHPAGVLETRLRPLPDPQIHRAWARSRSLPQLLQHSVSTITTREPSWKGGPGPAGWLHLQHVAARSVRCWL